MKLLWCSGNTADFDFAEDNPPPQVRSLLEALPNLSSVGRATDCRCVVISGSSVQIG